MKNHLYSFLLASFVLVNRVTPQLNVDQTLPSTQPFFNDEYESITEIDSLSTLNNRAAAAEIVDEGAHLNSAAELKGKPLHITRSKLKSKQANSKAKKCAPLPQCSPAMRIKVQKWLKKIEKSCGKKYKINPKTNQAKVNSASENYDDEFASIDTTSVQPHPVVQRMFRGAQQLTGANREWDGGLNEYHFRDCTGDHCRINTAHNAVQSSRLAGQWITTGGKIASFVTAGALCTGNIPLAMTTGPIAAKMCIVGEVADFCCSNAQAICVDRFLSAEETSSIQTNPPLVNRMVRNVHNAVNLVGFGGGIPDRIPPSGGTAADCCCLTTLAASACTHSMAECTTSGASKAALISSFAVCLGNIHLASNAAAASTYMLAGGYPIACASTAVGCCAYRALLRMNPNGASGQENGSTSGNEHPTFEDPVFLSDFGSSQLWCELISDDPLIVQPGSRTCIICQDKDVNCQIHCDSEVPHNFCLDCTQDLRRRPSCPVCRRPVSQYTYHRGRPIEISNEQEMEERRQTQEH